MTATIAFKKRSNRPLTQFVCKHLERFALDNFQDSYQAEKKNTTVQVFREGSTKTFLAFLYEEEILRLTFAGDRPVSIKLSFTSFFDCYGQPSTTTCERLNGLLDQLGILGVIPHGVRLFRDQEYHTTYIGKGVEKVAVGEDLFTSVYITPNADKLIFAGYTSKITSCVEAFS